MAGACHNGMWASSRWSRRDPRVHEQATEVAVADECEVQTVQARPHRISWVWLLKRVFWLRHDLSTSWSAP